MPSVANSPTRSSHSLLRGSLYVISGVTVLSGLGQLVAPAMVLGMIGAEVTATSRHFFTIIGMFMFLFGGMLLQVLQSGAYQPVPVSWAGAQKLGAAVAVGAGVATGIFSWLALGVAGFDLFSAVLIFYLLQTSRPRL